MRTAVFLFASMLALCACNRGSKVDLKNANAGQVASAVKSSGVMDSNTMIEPGLWQSKVTTSEMHIPGLPPQYADKMKQAMAQSRDHVSNHCITAADVKKPREDFFGTDKSCKYRHFMMGGGKIDIQMECMEGESSMATNMSGTYTPTSYSMNMSSTASGGQQNGMSMKMHVVSERVGECTAHKG